MLKVIGQRHELSLFEHQLQIAVLNGAQPVRNHKRGTSTDKLFGGLHDLMLCVYVHGAGGLVKNQDGRILQEGLSNRNALPLASRKPATAFADFSVVSVWEIHDEIVCARRLGRIHDFFTRGAVTPISDVLCHCRRKYDRLLQDDGKLLPQAARAFAVAVSRSAFSYATLMTTRVMSSCCFAPSAKQSASRMS